jgi:hypothetical protein
MKAQFVFLIDAMFASGDLRGFKISAFRKHDNRDLVKPAPKVPRSSQAETVTTKRHAKPAMMLAFREEAWRC